MSRINIIKNNDAIPANRKHPLLIIGVGLNGLSAAYGLKRITIRPVILEASSKIAAPCRDRHDQLRLNTPRLISYLPGMRLPRSFGAYPARDDMVRYFEDYEQFLMYPSIAIFT